MSNQDWRYDEDRLVLRQTCLLFLLKKYGSVRLEEVSYSTKNIYECVDTWISQGNGTDQGIDTYFTTHFA